MNNFLLEKFGVGLVWSGELLVFVQIPELLELSLISDWIIVEGNSDCFRKEKDTIYMRWFIKHEALKIHNQSSNGIIHHYFSLSEREREKNKTRKHVVLGY